MEVINRRFDELLSMSMSESISLSQKEFKTLSNNETREQNQNIAPIFGKDTVVDQYLESVIIQNKNLALLRSHKTLLRQDHETLVDRVKILSGGAAIVDPLYSASIGEGMLTGAIFGTLKKSPPSLTILEVLRIMARKNKQGILVIVSNNLANRLNFGSACQNAAKEGIKTLLVNVGEDVSGVAVSKTIGRKGLCGIKFLFKIAGAMSEEKRTLQEIYDAIKKLKGNSLGSINVEIRLDKMVVGPSSKGEPEKLFFLWDTFDDIGEFSRLTFIVKQALSHLFHPSSYFSLRVVKGDDIVIIVNNMGNLSDFYLNIIVKEVLDQIKSLGINTQRLYSGRFLNSNIAGFTISVLKVKDDNTLELLDRPTAATSWAEKPPVVNTQLNLISELPSAPEGYIPTPGERKGFGPKFTKQEATYLIEFLPRIIDTITNLEDYLNKLDIDRDFGTSVSKFAHAVKIEINTRTLKISSPYEFLDQMSHLAGCKLGGVAGGVFSILLSSAAQVFQTSPPMGTVELRMWVDAAKAARDGLRRFTRVKPGEGPFLDALDPFHDPRDENPVRELSRKLSTIVKDAEDFTRTTRISIQSSIAFGSNEERLKSTVPEGGLVEKPREPDPEALCLTTVLHAIFSLVQEELAEMGQQAQVGVVWRRRDSRGSRRGTYAEEEHADEAPAELKKEGSQHISEHKGEESGHAIESRGIRNEAEVKGSKLGSKKKAKFDSQITVTVSHYSSEVPSSINDSEKTGTDSKHDTQLQETDGDRLTTTESKHGTQLKEIDGERGTRLTTTESKHGTQLPDTDDERGTQLISESIVEADLQTEAELKRETEIGITEATHGTEIGKTEATHGTEIGKTESKLGTALGATESKRGPDTHLKTSAESKDGTELGVTESHRGTDTQIQITSESKHGTIGQEATESHKDIDTQLKTTTESEHGVEPGATETHQGADTRSKTTTESKHGVGIGFTESQLGSVNHSETATESKHDTESRITESKVAADTISKVTIVTKPSDADDDDKRKTLLSAAQGTDSRHGTRLPANESRHTRVQANESRHGTRLRATESKRQTLRDLQYDPNETTKEDNAEIIERLKEIFEEIINEIEQEIYGENN